MKDKNESFFEYIKKNKYNIIKIIIILGIGIMIGMTIQKLLNNKKSSEKLPNQMNQVYNSLLKEYKEEINESDLEQAAIKGMIESLDDDYTDYYTKDESSAFYLRLKGTFVGIGVEITKDDNNETIINAIIENTPASEKGLKAKDKIISINGEEVKEKELSEITTKIKNVNEKIKLVVERDGEKLTFELQARENEIPSVYSEILETDGKKIGYIAITIFAENTDEQFAKKLAELEKENIEGLIIDVRSNTGGHLDTVTNILKGLLPKNSIMYQIKHGENVKLEKNNLDNQKKYKITVLVNELSASASEILASSLNENLGSEIVGMKTFGKGTVQKVMALNTGAMIKYTSDYWLTSKGNEINKKGVSPTIEVQINSKYFETYDKKDDNQLQGALKTFN